MKYWLALVTVLLVAALFGLGYTTGRSSVHCPPVVVPLENEQLQRAVDTAQRAKVTADSLLHLPPPKPIIIRVNEKQKEFRGMRRDSLMRILDDNPSAD